MCRTRRWRRVRYGGNNGSLFPQRIEGREACHEAAQERQAEERPRRQGRHGEEPQAGDRDRSLRGPQEGQEGAEAQERQEEVSEEKVLAQEEALDPTSSRQTPWLFRQTSGLPAIPAVPFRPRACGPSNASCAR